MPGSATLNAPSYRPALVGSHMPGSSLLASLSGKARVVPGTAGSGTAGAGTAGAGTAGAGTAGSGTTGFGTISRLVQTRSARSAVSAGTEPWVKSDIAQFARAVAVAATPAQLLANAIALRVLLTAHGLADQADNPALAIRALLSNPARANSLLNQLKDPRWFAVNTLYSFATQGLTMLRKPAAIAAITRAYAAAPRVTGLDRSFPHPSVALNFPGSPRHAKSAQASLQQAEPPDRE